MYSHFASLAGSAALEDYRISKLRIPNKARLSSWLLCESWRGSNPSRSHLPYVSTSLSGISKEPSQPALPPLAPRPAATPVAGCGLRVCGPLQASCQPSYALMCTCALELGIRDPQRSQECDFLAAIEAYRGMRMEETGGDHPTRIKAGFASAGLFSLGCAGPDRPDTHRCRRKRRRAVERIE